MAEEVVVSNKEIEKKKNMPIFVLKIVGNVIFYLVILCLLLFSIMNINAGNRKDGFPNIFGKGMLSVLTNSMDGSQEDSFKSGDLIFVNVFNEKDYNSLQEGQVVTFYDTEVNNGTGGLNSHRIVSIKRDSNNNIESLAVQGDKSVDDYGWKYDPTKTDVDSSRKNSMLISSNQVAFLNASDIKGVMTGVWSGAGTVLQNIQNNWLFIFVIPVLLFLIFEIFMVVKNVMALKNEKNKGIIDAKITEKELDLEAQKEAIRQQVLAELRASGIAVAADETISPTEEIKTEETTVVESTEEIKAEDSPVVESTEEIKAEETPVVELTEEIKAEETPVVELTEEIKAEETPVVESTEEIKTEETANEVIKASAKKTTTVKKSNSTSKSASPAKAPTKKSATTSKTPVKKSTATSKATTTKKPSTASTTKTAVKKTSTKKSTAKEQKEEKGE